MSRLDAVLASLGARADEAERRLEAAERMARETQALRVRGESGDRLVEATVDGVGQLVDLRFEGLDRLDRLSGDGAAERLRAAVLEALRHAQQRLATEVERIGEAVYGEGSAAADTIARSYRDRYGQEEQ